MDRATDNVKEKYHFKMDRFALQNGEWFYVTREGDERGPFVCREDAEGDIAIYIRLMSNMPQYA